MWFHDHTTLFLTLLLPYMVCIINSAWVSIGNVPWEHMFAVNQYYYVYSSQGMGGYLHSRYTALFKVHLICTEAPPRAVFIYILVRSVEAKIMYVWAHSAGGGTCLYWNEIVWNNIFLLPCVISWSCDLVLHPMETGCVWVRNVQWEQYVNN